MESEFFFCSFVSGDGRCLKIRSEWERNGFKLNILVNVESWEGHITVSEISKQLSGADIKLFIDKSKEILTKKNKNHQCKYDLDGDVFMWQQRGSSGDVKFSGFMSMKQVPYNSSVFTFVNTFITLNAKLSEELRNLENVSKALEIGKQNILSQLDLEVKSKQAMEEDLLSKFYLLFREKERMISLLNDLT